VTRPFLIYPHKTLKAEAAPVERVDDKVRALWDEMLEAMYAMPGVGLAAPQLGSSLRVIVIDASEDGVRRPVRMANPELLETSDQTRTQTEASPNLPGQYADVARPAEVRVRFLNAEGEQESRTFTGLWATSVQHQIDHLNGRLFIDRLGPVKRRMLLAKHAKRHRR